MPRFGKSYFNLTGTSIVVEMELKYYNYEPEWSQFKDTVV